MPVLSFPRPDALDDLDAGRLDDWLKTKGVDARVRVRGDGLVDLVFPDGAAPDEKATKALLVTYTKAETARETFEREAIADAVQLVKAIAAKPAANRTPAERILLGLALSIRDLQQQV